jgi:F420-dependent oxidoreductase-like protein
MKPWFGLHIPSFTFPDQPPERIFDRVVELAMAAENSGFALVTVMDHFYQIQGVGPETDPMLEAYSTLSAVAARTSKVRLGALVSGVTYRNPAVLAKTVTTLDVISGGRALLGLGAAWNEDEHKGYGYEFPPIRERMDRLDEALTIAKAMFTEDRPSFEGRYYRIDRALNVPRPIQQGGPKILVGGGGEQRTLKIAAKHADMTHWFPLGLEALSTRRRCSRATARRSGAIRRRSSGRWRRRSSWSRRRATPRRFSTDFPRSGARTSSPDHRIRRPKGCAPTSTPGSRASHSITPCCERPNRSLSPANCSS